MENKPPAAKARKAWRIPVELILFVLVVAAYLWVVFAPTNSFVNWFSTDDAYYYFKVAQNIGAGRGVTFDGINPTNGFHPLWMLVCIPVFLLANTAPILALRILAFILILLTAGSSALLFRFLKDRISIYAAWFAALFWAFIPAIGRVTTQDGLEAGISAFFIILFLSAAVKYREDFKGSWTFSRILILGLLAALVILSRLDNIFIVGAISIWLVFRDLKIRQIVILEGIAAGLSMLFAYAIRIGMQGNFTSFARTIYFSVFLAAIIKPVMIFPFIQSGNSPKKRSIWNILFLTGISSSISSILLGMILFVASRLSRQFNFSISALLVDLIIFSLVNFVLIFIFWKNQLENAERSNIFLGFSWKKFFLESGSYLLPLILFVGGYLIWSKVNFSTFTPISGQVKMWWATLPNTVYGHPIDLINFMGLSVAADNGPWSLFAIIPSIIAATFQKGSSTSIFLGLFVLEMLAISVLLLIRKEFLYRTIDKLGWLALLVGCLVQISFYRLVSYPNTRMWYWVGELLASTILLAITFENLVSLARQVKLEWLKTGAVIVTGLIIFTSFSLSLFKTVPIYKKDQAVNLVFAEVDRLEKATEDKSVIGMPGGGNTAYFISDRTIINLDGLINSPEYFSMLKAGQVNDFLYRMGVSYIYGNEYMITQSDPYRQIFAGKLTTVEKMPNTNDFVLYRYNSTGN